MAEGVSAAGGEVAVVVDGGVRGPLVSGVVVAG